MHKIQQPRLPNTFQELLELYQASDQQLIRISILSKIKHQIIFNKYCFNQAYSLNTSSPFKYGHQTPVNHSTNQPKQTNFQCPNENVFSFYLLNMILNTRKSSTCNDLELRLYFKVMALAIKHTFQQSQFKKLMQEITQILQKSREKIYLCIQFFIQLLQTMQKDYLNLHKQGQLFGHAQLQRCKFERYFSSNHIHSMITIANFLIDRSILKSYSEEYHQHQNVRYKLKNSPQNITKILKLLHTCFTFDFQGENKSEETNDFLTQKSPLILPTRTSKYTTNAIENWLKCSEWIEIYQFLYFQNNHNCHELKLIIITILGDMLRIHMKSFKIKNNYKIHIQNIIYALANIIQYLQMKTQPLQSKDIQVVLCVGHAINKLTNPLTINIFFTLKPNIQQNIIQVIKTFIQQQIINKHVFHSHILHLYFQFLLSLYQNTINKKQLEEHKDDILNKISTLCRTYQPHLRTMICQSFTIKRQYHKGQHHKGQYHKHNDDSNGSNQYKSSRIAEEQQHSVVELNYFKESIESLNIENIEPFFLPFKIYKPRQTNVDSIYQLLAYICSKIQRNFNLQQSTCLEPWEKQICHTAINQCILKMLEWYKYTSYYKKCQKDSHHKQNIGSGDMKVLQPQNMKLYERISSIKNIFHSDASTLNSSFSSSERYNPQPFNNNSQPLNNNNNPHPLNNNNNPSTRQKGSTKMVEIQQLQFQQSIQNEQQFCNILRFIVLYFLTKIEGKSWSMIQSLNRNSHTIYKLLGLVINLVYNCDLAEQEETQKYHSKYNSTNYNHSTTNNVLKIQEICKFAYNILAQLHHAYQMLEYNSMFKVNLQDFTEYSYHQNQNTKQNNISLHKNDSSEYADIKIEFQQNPTQKYQQMVQGQQNTPLKNKVVVQQLMQVQDENNNEMETSFYQFYNDHNMTSLPNNNYYGQNHEDSILKDLSVKKEAQQVSTHINHGDLIYQNGNNSKINHSMNSSSMNGSSMNGHRMNSHNGNINSGKKRYNHKIQNKVDLEKESQRQQFEEQLKKLLTSSRSTLIDIRNIIYYKRTTTEYTFPLQGDTSKNILYDISPIKKYLFKINFILELEHTVINCLKKEQHLKEQHLKEQHLNEQHFSPYQLTTKPYELLQSYYEMDILIQCLEQCLIYLQCIQDHKSTANKMPSKEQEVQIIKGKILNKFLLQKIWWFIHNSQEEGHHGKSYRAQYYNFNHPSEFQQHFQQHHKQPTNENQREQANQRQQSKNYKDGLVMLQCYDKLLRILPPSQQQLKQQILSKIYIILCNIVTYLSQELQPIQPIAAQNNHSYQTATQKSHPYQTATYKEKVSAVIIKYTKKDQLLCACIFNILAHIYSSTQSDMLFIYQGVQLFHQIAFKNQLIKQLYIHSQYQQENTQFYGMGGGNNIGHNKEDVNNYYLYSLCQMDCTLQFLQEIIKRITKIIQCNSIHHQNQIQNIKNKGNKCMIQSNNERNEYKQTINDSILIKLWRCILAVVNQFKMKKNPQLKLSMFYEFFLETNINSIFINCCKNMMKPNHQKMQNYNHQMQNYNHQMQNYNHQMQNYNLQNNNNLQGNLLSSNKYNLQYQNSSNNIMAEDVNFMITLCIELLKNIFEEEEQHSNNKNINNSYDQISSEKYLFKTNHFLANKHLKNQILSSIKLFYQSIASRSKMFGMFQKQREGIDSVLANLQFFNLQDQGIEESQEIKDKCQEIEVTFQNQSIQKKVKQHEGEQKHDQKVQISERKNSQKKCNQKQVIKSQSKRNDFKEQIDEEIYKGSHLKLTKMTMNKYLDQSLDQEVAAQGQIQMQKQQKISPQQHFEHNQKKICNENEDKNKPKNIQCSPIRNLTNDCFSVQNEHNNSSNRIKIINLSKKIHNSDGNSQVENFQFDQEKLEEVFLNKSIEKDQQFEKNIIEMNHKEIQMQQQAFLKYSDGFKQNQSSEHGQKMDEVFEGEDRKVVDQHNDDTFEENERNLLFQRESRLQNQAEETHYLDIDIEINGTNSEETNAK